MLDVQAQTSGGGAPARTAIILAYSALADDPRVRRMGDYLHAHGWRVVGIGLPGAKSTPPEWTIHEALFPAVAPVAVTALPAAEKPSGFPPPIDSPLPFRRSVARKIRSLIAVSLGPPPPIGQRASFLRRVARKVRSLSSVPRYLIHVVVARARSAARLVRRAAHYLVALAAAAAAALTALALAPVRPGWTRDLLSIARTFASPRNSRRALDEFVYRWRTARSQGEGAEHAFWSQAEALNAMRGAAETYGVSGLWIANDWLMLPIAAAGVARFGGAYVYDSHEFATEEYAQRLEWRLFQQPLVRTIERRYIAAAAVVTSVSSGITEALARTYNLKAPTATLRNLPRYQELAFRVCGSPIRVLYHGVVAEGRGLEETIDALQACREEFHLTIRGPGPATFIEALGSRARRLGLEGRVTIEPPIPTTQLIAAAAAYDVGMMALPGHSAHNAFALPNKVFEYLMAGLAICVSDLPAMAAVVAETGAGVLIAEVAPDAIARAINGLDRDRINAMKIKALVAARHLHFDADAEPVAKLYESALKARA
ncbi:MAG TPA: glycosyltransferase [Caulobacterales bacterium]|nr:glycosyltransferase [Caulobacterales bacterium]